MKHIKSITLIAVSAILITSCGKKNSNLGKMIPKEAAVVVDLNTKSLLSKLPWDTIKKTYWYNELIADTTIPAASKTFMDDPAKTGLDINSDILFFVLRADSSAEAVVEGSLKDSKVFSDFLKNMHPNAVVNKDGELNIATAHDAVIGWNTEKFVIVANADHHHFHDSDSLNDSTKNVIPLKPESSQNLISVCKSLFTLSNDKSLYENEKFARLAEEDGDVHFWININELSKGSMKGMPGMMGMVKLDKFLVDNISTTTVNFQDGKITAMHKQYFGKELSDILKKSEENFNTDMVKRLPQNSAAVFTLHLTPASILEIIKLTGLDGFINLFLSQQGISLDDVVKATKGDIVFSASNVSVTSDSLGLKSTADSTGNYHYKPNATFLFAVAINDKDAFNKLINISKTMGKDMGPKNIFSKSDDKYFAISNSQDAVNKYFLGTTSSPDFLSKINDHPMGGFVDFQMILKAVQPEFTKDSNHQFYYNRNLSMWNNLYFSGGEYKNGGIVTSAELNMVDKTTNSLLQLNKYLDDNAKVMIEKRRQQKAELTMDSTSSKAKKDSIPSIKKKPLNKPRK